MTVVEGAGPAPGRIVFVDTETTGLRDWHEPWEIALIARDAPDAPDEPVLYAVRPDVSKGDPEALAIGRYYQRTRRLASPRTGVDGGLNNLAHHAEGDALMWRWSDSTAAALAVARITAGAVLVGCNTQFDARVLSRFLCANGQAPAWHYRPVDVGAMAYGYLHGRYAGAIIDAPAYATRLPWTTEHLALALEVSVDPDARHTALGDARFARDIFDAMTSSDAR